MSERGVFRVDRRLLDHPIFKKERSNRRDAWLSLICEAAFQTSADPKLTGFVGLQLLPRRADFLHDLQPTLSAIRCVMRQPANLPLVWNRDPHSTVEIETYLQKSSRAAFSQAIELWHRTKREADRQAAIRASNAYMVVLHPSPQDHKPLLIDPLFVWGFN
jgi:hypothetical protein